MSLVLVRPHVFPGKQEIAVEAHAGGGDATGDDRHLEISLTCSDGKEVVAVAPASQLDESGRAEARFDASELSPGPYMVKARSVSDGSGVVEEAIPLVWPERPRWLGSLEGYSDEVLDPWTSLEIHESESELTVRTWGRCYRFGDLPFPAGVETAGREVLSSPISIAAVVEGTAQEWTGRSAQLSVTTPARAEFTGEAVAEDLEISARVRVDFDGMIRVDWDLRPRRALTLDALTLELFLKPEHARYLYYYPGRWGSTYNARTLPQEPVLIPFRPLVWLGDEERGLAWFCESDYNWVNTHPDAVTELVTKKDAVILRLHLLDEPLSLDPGAPEADPSKAVTVASQPLGALSYTFGFQATPVKPLTQDAWDFRSSHAGDYGIESEPSGYAALTYPAVGNINLKRGTLELWAKPGFDPGVAQDQELFTANLPESGQVRWYWSAESGALRVTVNQGDRSLAECSAPLQWRPDVFHHVALSWGDALRIYADGELVAEAPHRGLLDIDLDAGIPLNLQAENYPLIADPRFASLVFGGKPSKFTVDDIRFSDIQRPEAEIAYTATGGFPAECDVYTTLLDRLDSTSDPGNVDRLDGHGVYTRPVTGSPRRGTGGIVVRNAKYAPGKFGNGLQLYAEEPILDRLAQLGVRTVCFHEHWSDLQSYHDTTHTEELHSLVRGCHERGIQLLLYFGFQMSRLAPEFEAFHEECLIEPLSGYDFNRPPQLHQPVFRVCYNSPWQDSLVARIAALIDEFDIDGVYLDGTASPSACANLEHGCGYVRSDGSVAVTYPIFAVRQTMRRIYSAVKGRKPEGQVNVHQSTCMTIPTLAWATSLWDGEQFASIEPGPFALTVLPLDAFRTEFMGHQWGLPQEFLCYERPYTYTQGCSFALLHDVPVRPLGPGLNLELASRLWQTFDDFRRREAEWFPYWRNGQYVSVEPKGALVSLYRHHDSGVLAIVSNLEKDATEVRIRFSLSALGLEGSVWAIDAITGEIVDLNDGSVVADLPSLGWQMLWLREA